MQEHLVRVHPLPPWLDAQRLLGPERFRLRRIDERGSRLAEAVLSRAAAADLQARLRGVGLAGRALAVEVEPPLPRASVRRARVLEARRYREGSPGLSRAGVKLDPETRRGLTPEALAVRIGRRARGARVLDATCGAGGNAIGFARAGCWVTAVDRDPRRLAMARWNAGVYGVADRIRFELGDARELVARSRADLLFIDPPWVGRGGAYDKRRVVAADLPLIADLLAHRARFARVLVKVPLSFDPETLEGAHPEAYFGVAPGDSRRIKFLLLSL